MRTHLSLSLLGVAVLTAGALVLQLSRKPDVKPKPVTGSVEPVGTVAFEPPPHFVDRLRERGL